MNQSSNDGIEACEIIEQDNLTESNIRNEINESHTNSRCDHLNNIINMKWLRKSNANESHNFNNKQISSLNQDSKEFFGRTEEIYEIPYENVVEIDSFSEGITLCSSPVVTVDDTQDNQSIFEVVQLSNSKSIELNIPVLKDDEKSSLSSTINSVKNTIDLEMIEEQFHEFENLPEDQIQELKYSPEEIEPLIEEEIQQQILTQKDRFQELESISEEKFQNALSSQEHLQKSDSRSILTSEGYTLELEQTQELKHDSEEQNQESEPLSDEQIQQIPTPVGQVLELKHDSEEQNQEPEPLSDGQIQLTPTPVGQVLELNSVSEEHNQELEPLSDEQIQQNFTSEGQVLELNSVSEEQNQESEPLSYEQIQLTPTPVGQVLELEPDSDKQIVHTTPPPEEQIQHSQTSFNKQTENSVLIPFKQIHQPNTLSDKPNQQLISPINQPIHQSSNQQVKKSMHSCEKQNQQTLPLRENENKQSLSHHEKQIQQSIPSHEKYIEKSIPVVKQTQNFEKPIQQFIREQHVQKSMPSRDHQIHQSIPPYCKQTHQSIPPYCKQTHQSIPPYCKQTHQSIPPYCKQTHQSIPIYDQQLEQPIVGIQKIHQRQIKKSFTTNPNHQSIPSREQRTQKLISTSEQQIQHSKPGNNHENTKYDQLNEIEKVNMKSFKKEFHPKSELKTNDKKFFGRSFINTSSNYNNNEIESKNVTISNCQASYQTKSSTNTYQYINSSNDQNIISSSSNVNYKYTKSYNNSNNSGNNCQQQKSQHNMMNKKTISNQTLYTNKQNGIYPTNSSPSKSNQQYSKVVNQPHYHQQKSGKTWTDGNTYKTTATLQNQDNNDQQHCYVSHSSEQIHNFQNSDFSQNSSHCNSQIYTNNKLNNPNTIISNYPKMEDQNSTHCHNRITENYENDQDKHLLLEDNKVKYPKGVDKSDEYRINYLKSFGRGQILHDMRECNTMVGGNFSSNSNVTNLCEREPTPSISPSQFMSSKNNNKGKITHDQNAINNLQDQVIVLQMQVSYLLNKVKELTTENSPCNVCLPHNHTNKPAQSASVPHCNYAYSNAYIEPWLLHHH